MSQSVQLSIDTAHNRAQFGDHPPCQFTRRWEAALLALLCQAGGAPVSAAQCNAALAERGQRQPLNRAQYQRLFDAIAAFLDAHGGQPINVHTQPRQWSTGPWALGVTQPVEVTVDGQPRPALSPRPAWPHPAITALGDLGSLHAVLHSLLVSDAFAVCGQWLSALAPLNALAQSPLLWPRLTPEAQSLIDVRRATCHRRMGDYDLAFALLQTVAERSAPADPAAAEYARFLLHRIQYDRAPTLHHRQLWADTAVSPAAHGVQDARSMSEWHNLRALLARRRIEEQLQPAAHPNPKPRPKSHRKAGDDPPALHQLALRHYQAAIYHTLWAADMTRLQAYLHNLTWHLQTWGQLTRWGQDATMADALRWQRLAMAYHDKFDVGQDTAWEYIFVAEFWLNDPIDLNQLDPADRFAFECHGLLPDDERFYTTAIDRLHTVADARQLTIMLALYLRFAKQHLPNSARVQGRIGAELRQLLAAQPLQFTEMLKHEGYGPWLPSSSAPWQPKQDSVRGQGARQPDRPR